MKKVRKRFYCLNKWLIQRRTDRNLAEHLLRGVAHVQEAVFVAFFVVDLGERHRHARDAAVVHEQVEGLVGVQRHAVSYDGHELRHGELLWHQELRLVHLAEALLLRVLFDYNRNFIGKLAANLTDLVTSQSEWLSLLECALIAQIFGHFGNHWRNFWTRWINKYRTQFTIRLLFWIASKTTVSIFFNLEINVNIK